MTKLVREIVEIDEELCDGCGLCVPSCAEGAIQIIDGKAKLVSENLCDGFGNCLGTCPQDAIKITRREADEYDEEAVEQHLKSSDERESVEFRLSQPLPSITESQPNFIPSRKPAFGGCPGSAVKMFDDQLAKPEPEKKSVTPSALTQWPVQLMLVPPTAPFLKGREVLLAADCGPFAFADFHQKFIRGRALLVGCPKLDDLRYYREKLEVIFRDSGCTGVTVLVMEVPCCTGLEIVAREALAASGRNIPMKKIVIGIRGEVQEETEVGRSSRSA